MVLSELPFLIGTSGLLGASFLFSAIALGTSGWHDAQSDPFLSQYNLADKATKKELLWLVGTCVLIILGIVCTCFTAVIVTARFFGHSQGRIKLGGFLSIFTGVTFIVALAIFMLQYTPAESTYGYSFGLMWASVPLSIAAGIIMMFLPDSDFLDSEVETYSPNPK